MIFNMKQQTDLPCHDRLNSYGATSLAKKDRIRVLKESVEESRFDFQPKIDKISRIINDEREKSINQVAKPRYDLLYHDAKQRSTSKSLTRNHSST